MKPLGQSLRVLRWSVPKLLHSWGQASLAKGKGKICVACRRLDTAGEERRIAAILLEQADRANIKLYKLPSTTGTRFGVAEGLRSSFVSALLKRCKHENVAHSVTVKGLENNLYEFDQVDFTAPDMAVMIDLHPAPHCSVGKGYLAARKVSLELLEAHNNAIVVPMPGLGPRVIGREQAERLAVRPATGAEIEADWPFPIDLVYTWVDTEDDIWKANFASVAHEVQNYSNLTAATNAARWHSRDELKYSLRSLEMYAPFIRKIFIVTNGQKPNWIKESDRLRIIPHEALYPDSNVLPTFNSNHIETVLHNIPDLSENFLYLNDDFFFGSRCTPDDFFTVGGLGKVFYSSRHLDALPVTKHDRATVAAHKNCRRALEERLGQTVYQKFKHAPYTMKKSVWNEIEAVFRKELKATREHRFRSRDNINGQFLYAQYALLTGHACPADISYRYLDIQDQKIESRLVQFELGTFKVFCINDADSINENVENNENIILTFLETRFPNPSEWEKIG